MLFSAFVDGHVSKLIRYVDGELLWATQAMPNDILPQSRCHASKRFRSPSQDARLRHWINEKRVLINQKESKENESVNNGHVLTGLEGQRNALSLSRSSLFLLRYVSEDNQLAE